MEKVKRASFSIQNHTAFPVVNCPLSATLDVASRTVNCCLHSSSSRLLDNRIRLNPISFFVMLSGGSAGVRL